MSERVFVMGGQGFIGRSFVAEWRRRHPDGEVLTAGRSPARDGAVRHVQVDVGDTAALTRALRAFAPDAVVHLAAALRDEPIARLLEVNVAGVASLLSAVAASGAAPRRIVLGSSGAVYGVPGRLPIDETAACAPADAYGMSKQAGETAARILAAQHGLPLTVARIFNPVGPGQDERHFTTSVARQVLEIAAGRRAALETGPLDATRDFIDVRDVAVALALLVEADAPEPVYNVASGVETPIADVIAFALRAAGVAEDVPRIVLPRPNPVPRHVARVDRLARLGFRPAHSLDDSIAEVMRVYTRNSAEPARARMSVAAAAHHSYPVEVEAGLRRAVPDRLAAMFPGARLVLLTDSRVHGLYGAELLDGLRRVDPRAGVLFVGEGELHKSLASHERLIGELRDLGFDRRAVLVNLGGGVVMDVGGFVAATYMRGVAYVNVPTTLLAQHDAAIGGKVAVNTEFAKNFVGAFHHPRAVFADPATLATIDERHLAAGVAEAIKVAICGDQRLFELLESERGAIRARDPVVLGEVVRRAIAGKIALLAPDPYEHDLRRALNLGHSFGHPLETEMEYSGILHGEAVGYGLAVAVEVSRARGVCSDAAARRIHALLAAYGLPPSIPYERLQAARARMAEIRLVRGNALHFVLPAGIAAVEIVPHVSDDEIRRAIDAVAWPLGAPLAEAAC